MELAIRFVVPKDEARDFKNEFQNAKIEGLKQLKAINNIKLVSKKPIFEQGQMGLFLELQAKDISLIILSLRMNGIK